VSSLFIDLWDSLGSWLREFDPNDLLAPGEIIEKMNDLEEENS
jgi:hypothetical protein